MEFLQKFGWNIPTGFHCKDHQPSPNHLLSSQNISSNHTQRTLLEYLELLLYFVEMERVHLLFALTRSIGRFQRSYDVEKSEYYHFDQKSTDQPNDECHLIDSDVELLQQGTTKPDVFFLIDSSTIVKTD